MIDPSLSMPVLLGVLAGALLGAKILAHARVVVLRKGFSVMIVFLAFQMIYHGLTGKL